MKTAPYKLLGESELLRIRTALAQGVARWRGNWLGGSGDALLAVMPACDLSFKTLGASDDPTRVRSLGEERWVAVFAGRRVTSALAAALSGPGTGAHRMGAVTPLLQGVLDPCLAALCDELAGGSADGPQDAAAVSSIQLGGALRRGSGAVAALVEIEGERLGLVLGRDLVSGIIGAPRAAPRGGLSPRAQSIQNGRAQVRVIAGSTEIGVAALSSVAPGDVILLDTALDATFGLVNAEGLTVARGYLGALAGRKAFQLTS